MSKEEKAHDPRRSAVGLGIPESSAASSADHAPTRRRTKFNTAGANLRRTVGPEYRLVSDYQPSVDPEESVPKAPKDPTRFLPTFSFLKLNPFSFFKSSAAKEKASVETPSTSTATTTGKQKTVISWAKTTKVLYAESTVSSTVDSSRSSRGSTSSVSSRGSVTELPGSLEVPPSDKVKAKRSIAAAAAAGRKSIVVAKAKKSLAAGTPVKKVEQRNSISVQAKVSVQKETEKVKPAKVEYAPQLSSRRHKSSSYLSSIPRRGGSRVHPATSETSMPTASASKKSKVSKKPGRLSDASAFLEPSATSGTSAAATFLSETDESVLLSQKGSSEAATIGTTTTTAYPSQTHTALTVDSNLRVEDPPTDRYKTWRKKLGLRSDVIRVRNSINGQAYKFSAMNSGVGGGRRMTRKSFAFVTEDPLQENNIQRAADYKGWVRSAHMALPSKIGVPVEETNDVLRAGMDAVDQTDAEGVDPRDAYDRVLGSMQKHVYRKSMSAVKSVLGEGHDSDAHKRMSTLKLVPEHLATKRAYKKRLVFEGESETVGAEERKSWKHKAGLSFSIFHNVFRDVLFYCSIWRSTIREIHGRFGITTAVYFQCIRSILVLNVAYFLTIFVFLVIPEIVIDLRHPRQYNSEPSAGCYAKSEGTCKQYSPKINKRLGFSATDFITGEGSLENTYLYFSGFRDNTAQDSCPLKPEANLDEQYENPLSVTAFRFILVSFLLFVINSVYISFRIVNYYHAAGLQTKVPGMAKKDLFRMLLCAWDFSCTDPEGAKALHKSIRRELRELSGGMAKEKADALNTAAKDQTVNFFVSKYGTKIGQIIIHWLLNAAVVLACGIAGTMIYFAYYSRVYWVIQYADKCNTFTPPPTLLLIAPALFISVTTELMTLFCSWCSNFEKWTTAERKNFTLFGRIGLYYIANIVAIYGYAVSYSDFLHKRPNNKETESQLVYSLCYEEKIGEEIYRVVVIHSFIHCLASWVGILYHWIRKKINPKFSKQPIFDPTYHALDVFFVHTICGFGYLYCPLISLIFIIRLIIIFYNNKLILYKYSSLPEHLSYVSEISAPYFVTFFMTYFITTVLNVYTFVELDSSFTCGPFTHFHQKVSSGRSAKGHYYNVLEEVLKSVTSSSISKFAKPGIVWVFIFFLIGLIYTFKAWADGYALTLENLHELLVYEKKDRDFLLQAIFSVVREQNNADDEFDDYEDDLTGTPEEKGPRRTTAWQESPLVTGIFEFRRKSLGAAMHPNMTRRPTMYDDSTMFINASDNLDATASASRPKKSFVPPTIQDLPSYAFRKKVSVADVWIKAYFDVRKARRHSRRSEELKNLEKLYGHGQMHSKNSIK